jgi:hypothetical protein
MSNTMWDDLRRAADELEVQIHLASMDTRDRWRALQPRLAELERSIALQGDRAGQAIADELSSIGVALRRLRDDVKKGLERPRTP